MEGRKKRVLIAGGTNSIGKQAALDIANHPVELIIVGPDCKKGSQICEEIVMESTLTSDDIYFYKADLSLESNIKMLAVELKRDFRSLDVLICADGEIIPRYEETEDGLDKNLVVNYLTHYWLIQHLRPLLKDGRILLPGGNPFVVNHLRVMLPQKRTAKKYKGFEVAREALVARVLLMRFLTQPLKKQGIMINLFYPGSMMAARRGMHLVEEVMEMLSASHSPIISYLALDNGLNDVTGQFFNENKKRIKLSPKYTFIKAQEFYQWSKTQKGGII